MLKKVELLSPVGDFECLKAAVQNGANAVYLGSSDFNARYSAKNFSIEELEQAIDYAHLRNIKVFLTLNTLIKNDEFESALELANKAYELGIDGIIVQDLGLANFLIKNIPDLPMHASTQMTCHNLSGAKILEKAGFKRIVLSRELSLSEIEHITSNTSCEVEVFTHGALCISYSGQCLYSSLIGGRSGNRGKCAQGCRLPYTLIENDYEIDKGYLLSPRDLCSLELLPELINTGITSLKIEGRMKNPEYVATVTRIYRKYIDKIYNEETYIIEEQDKKDLLQVFNRGGFSTGHLSNEPNKELIFKDKPNNMGIYIGNVYNYNANRGHIKLTTQEEISIGDTISFEREDSKYTISELMEVESDKNLSFAKPGEKVTIGRMKGNIKPGDKIYKLSSKELLNRVKENLSQENIKSPINAILDIHLDEPIKLKIFDDKKNIVEVVSEDKPEKAINAPITQERLEKQLNKLADTPFYFKNIKINLDNNLFVPHISSINELRRNAINEYTKLLTNKYKRNKVENLTFEYNESNNELEIKHRICLLLNILNTDFDYSKLENIDKLYIPLKYFYLKEYANAIALLSNKFNTYIYLPTILKPNFKNLFKDTIEKSLNKYTVKGFVVSNIGYLDLLEEYKKDYEFIGNYNLNVFNNESINNLEIDTITISPELNKEEINLLALNSNIPTEFIVYGNLPLMTSSYCLLGKANRCYPNCGQKCSLKNKYYLKDRMNFLFRVLPDNIQTVTTIYNSKISSIDTNEISNINIFRIDILDESLQEINEIINVVKQGNRLEGKEYTNGNLNRYV